MGYNIILIFAILFLLSIPGILISFALLRGIKFNWADKSIIGIVLGLLLNPLMAVLEFILFGMDYGTNIVIINWFILLAIPLIAFFFQKQYQFDFNGIGKYFTPDFYRRYFEKNQMSVAVYAILLILLITGFYIRFSTAWSTSFFEFDPYFYDSVTEHIIKEGKAPLTSDISFFPRARSFRELPMIHYMTGGWYLLYMDIGGNAYNMNDLMLTIQFYPPLLALFMIFFAYLFIREESDKYIGLIAAAMFAFTPQLIKKMGAGVTEQAPFGFFAAIFIFALYAIAINRKSYRMGLLAALSMMLAFMGSAHFIYPAAFITGYIFLSSILEFITKDIDPKIIIINGMVVAFALAADIFNRAYKGTSLIFPLYSPITLFMILCFGLYVIFYLYGKFNLYERISRPKFLLLLLVIGIVALSFAPAQYNPIGYINSLLRTAKTDNPLNRTIQEENATSPSLFTSSFGILNPNQLLLGSTVLVVLLGMFALRKKGIYAISAFGVFAFGLVLLNKYVDMVFSAMQAIFESFFPDLSNLFAFIIEGDVFIYLVVSVIALMITYYYEEKQSKMQLLFLLAFFPTAYIGLNKTKYLVHLALALALALPFILVIFSELMKRLNSEFKLVSNEKFAMGLLILVFLIGAGATYKQFETVNTSMYELQYSRMTSDWIDATSWMRANINQTGRMLSWWDYGHWTTFLGGTKTVLDPSNYYSDYDQLTARGFVDGNTSLLIDVMHYHNATHIIVDSELVQKWGALVYLSGTYNGLSKGAPAYEARFDMKALIPSTSLPGSSQYETEHYFEYLYAVLNPAADGTYTNKVCPGIIPKQMLYSSFGAIYCMDPKGNLFWLDSAGLEKQLKTSVPSLVYTGDTQISAGEIQKGVYINTRYLFINLNPDLSTITNGNVNSALNNSAFVQLYFHEKLDGFSLVYKSPNNQVKIFKLNA